MGDTARHYDGAVRGLAAHFVWLNHGKESVELNLSRPGGRRGLRPPARPGRRAGQQPGAGRARPPRPRPGRPGRAAPPADRRRHLRLRHRWAAGPQARLRPARAVRGRARARSPVFPVRPPSRGSRSPTSARRSTPTPRCSPRCTTGERTGHGAVIPVAMLDVVAEMMGFALNTVLHGGAEPMPVGMGSPDGGALRRLPPRATGRPSCSARPATASGGGWRATSSNAPTWRPTPATRATPTGWRPARRSTRSSGPGAPSATSPTSSGGPTRPGSATPGSTPSPTSPGTPSSSQRGRWRDVDSPVGPGARPPAARAGAGLDGAARPAFPRWAPTPTPCAAELDEDSPAGRARRAASVARWRVAAATIRLDAQRRRDPGAVQHEVVVLGQRRVGAVEVPHVGGAGLVVAGQGIPRLPLVDPEDRHRLPHPAAPGRRRAARAAPPGGRAARSRPPGRGSRRPLARALADGLLGAGEDPLVGQQRDVAAGRSRSSTRWTPARRRTTSA